MEPKIGASQAISMNDLKLEVEKIKKREEEPNIRVNKVEDYLNSLLQLTNKQEKELIQNIQNLKIPRLKDEHVIKIVDLLPKHAEELKIIMQGYVISMTNENLQKIVDCVKAASKS